MMAIDDRMLLAYVDGELPPDQRDRVESALAHSAELADQVAALRASCLPYRMAFDQQALPPLPEHLPQRLATWVSLSQAGPAPAASAPAATRWQHSRREWLGLGGAMAASFAAGLWWPQLTRRAADAADAGWVEAIVSYQALYARDTVNELKEDPAQTRRVLREFSARTAAAVSVPDLSAEGLEFKRAQLLAFGSAPLLQMVYLPASGKPAALCVLPLAGGDAAVAARAMASLHVASWQERGLGFALVADRGMAATARLARDLALGRYRVLRSAHA